MSWRDEAAALMARIYIEATQSGETDRKKIADRIDAAYPFGERKHWPYKAWLAARRDFFTRHNLPRQSGSKAKLHRNEGLWKQ